MSEYLVEKRKTNEFLHKLNSMNIARGKGACINFQTGFDTGKRIPYYSYKELYKKKSKYGDVGDPKRKIWVPYESYYDSLSDAWESISSNPEYTDWLQTSTGLNHLVRNVIILDFDANKFMPNNFGYHDVSAAETDVKGFTAKYILPDCNYIYYNKTSGNIQVGWFLKSPLRMYVEDERSNYLRTGHALAAMWAEYKNMPGDVHFTGWQCKNPYNTNASNGSSIYSKTPVDTLDFIQKTRSYWSKGIKLNKKQRPRNVKITLKTGKHFADPNTSRDAYESIGLREWVWDYMRKHNGSEPSFEMAMDQMYQLAMEAAEVTGKGQHEYDELERICKNTLKWSVKHFSMDYAVYSDEQRHFAFLYTQTKKYYKYLQVKDLKGSCRSKANQIGCSASTVCRLSNLSENQIESMKLCFNEFKELVKELNSTYYNNKINKFSILIKMIEEFNTLKEKVVIKIKEYVHKLPFLTYILYNNRNGTDTTFFDTSPTVLASLALENSA